MKRLITLSHNSSIIAYIKKGQNATDNNASINNGHPVIEKGDASRVYPKFVSIYNPLIRNTRNITAPNILIAFLYSFYFTTKLFKIYYYINMITNFYKKSIL